MSEYELSNIFALASTVMFVILVLTANIYRLKHRLLKFSAIAVLWVSTVAVGSLMMGDNQAAFTRNTIAGFPATASLLGKGSFLNSTFKPQAFIITNERFLVYDADGRVYNLTGILPETSMTDLKVGSNIAYSVYQKGDHLYFGKL